MARPRSAEWTALLGEGNLLTVPPAVATALDLSAGSVVLVRVVDPRSHAALRRRGIGEEEIARIAKMQMEPRERAERFLLAEGALRRRARRRRAARR